MKLTQTFEVARPVAEVWAYLDDPQKVAGCLPGVEDIELRTRDEMDVRVTQSLGPMTATFAAAVTITHREVEKRIEFSATGKTVRGAMGNVRAAVVVELAPAVTGTLITLDGDVALAGALGAVGQKVVAKQAARVTGQFAENLARALGTDPVPAADATTGVATPAVVPARTGPTASTVPAASRFLALGSLGLGAASLVVGLLTYRLVRKGLVA